MNDGKMKNDKKSPSLLTSHFSFLIFSFLIFSFFACTPEKKLKEAEFLLVKNKIVADNKSVPVSDKITYVVQPRPNKRALGLFLSKVSIYQAMIPVEKPYYEQFKRKMRHSLGKYPVLLDTVSNDWYTSRWRNAKVWVQENFGEPPVLLDTGLIDYSVKQIDLMMRKIGYFNAETTYSIVFKQQTAKVIYKIAAGTSYKITDIQYDIADATLAKIILADTNRSLLQRGNIYDEYVLDNERSRIEERLLNRGYFSFSKNNIRYEADTSLGSGSLVLKLIVQNPQQKIDDSTFVEGKFRCYKIQSIAIYTEIESENTPFDSIYYSEVVNNSDTNTYGVFVPAGTLPYRPSALVYPLFFSTGDVYSSRRTRNSYDRYTDMRNFGYTKISYAETGESQANYQQDTGYLDCKIQLARLPRQFYDYDFFVKNTGGIYGLGVSALYGNRNLFKAAEIFTLSGRYTQELQMDQADSSWHFRNFEAGINASIEFPRFLFPVKQHRISKNFRPKTVVNLGANFIKHNYYSRLLISSNLTYNWMERLNSGKFIYHTFSLVDFGLIKMYNDTAFNLMIEQYNFSERVKEKYKNHFMLGSKYGFTLQRGNVYVLRTQFNAYGNLLYGIIRGLDAAKASSPKNDYGQYTIWGIPFESGLTADLDLVYNLVQRKRQALVYRLAVGVGVPIFNSTVLPYEKSFYLGGSNSMRAWRLRALGPGSFIDTSATSTVLERVGDIKFETNLEYRIPIYKYFTLGAFADIGNIWLIKQSDDFVNGEFAFNRFYKELAIDAGIGLRLDLSFFIVRVDYALKIHDPAKLQSHGWQTFNWSNYNEFKSDRTIVFGIGYPF
ncbi:MAG: outer membrane protein assembly factor [Lentimicrobiaceae bacterium]|nr:outer membrane protein assembly factor [Lentimicrobiaceae bacterium]